MFQSHSRPHQSNDKPYSEANFKILKYFPVFPRRFAGLASARAFVDGFFDHYNHHHRHSGIALHIPSDVHYGELRWSGRDARRFSMPPYAQRPSPVPHAAERTPPP